MIFVPFGILISTLWEEKAITDKILLAFCTSLILETLQYVFAVGASDITDLLTNTLGGAIGVGIYFIFSKIFKEKKTMIINTLSLVCASLFVCFLVLISL